MEFPHSLIRNKHENDFKYIVNKNVINLPFATEYIIFTCFVEEFIRINKKSFSILSSKRGCIEC